MNLFLKLQIVLAFVAMLLINSHSGPALAENDSSSHQEIEVELKGADTDDAESANVLAALKTLLKGIEHRDLNQIGNCLTDDVIMYDDARGNYLFGKSDVLKHIRKNVIGNGEFVPVKSFVIRNPFVRVKDNTAMVSFQAIKELRDAKPSELESWSSGILERKDGKWRVLEFRTNWRPAD